MPTLRASVYSVKITTFTVRFRPYGCAGAVLKLIKTVQGGDAENLQAGQ